MATVEKLSLFTEPLPAEGFHPAVATWFERRFPDGPTEAQAQGWVRIAAGDDTLVAAPTGSGKTLAGFLVGIDRLYRDRELAPLELAINHFHPDRYSYRLQLRGRVDSPSTSPGAR